MSIVKLLLKKLQKKVCFSLAFFKKSIIMIPVYTLIQHITMETLSSPLSMRETLMR